MRALIRDGILVDGTGSPPSEGVSLVIEDHVIEAIVDDPAPGYDRADVVIDARGGFILPGILDHHAHGMTRGPLMILAEPALSDDRVRRNCLRLLGEGVTRVLDVDGFAVVEEGRAASRFPGLTVATSTVHTPRHVEWATRGPFVFGGLKPRHHSTLAEQLALGAVAIGEIGPGTDDHWIDYTVLPLGIARAGGDATPDMTRRLRAAADGGDEAAVRTILAETGAAMDVTQLAELLAEGRGWCEMAAEACEEAVALAADFDVPVIIHHTPANFELVHEAAKRLGPRLICGHSNFQVLNPDEAVAHALELKRHGSLIDVMTGDASGPCRFTPSDEVTHAMMRAECVDLISTDYVGGYWDSMLEVVERAVAAGAVSLEDGVRAVTGRVADALPQFAPDRGTLEPGRVADVIVTEPGHLTTVTEIMVSGIAVDRDGQGEL
jgi:hypothetical protein